MSLDPSELGWYEFWLRIAVIVFMASVILLAVAIVVRVILTILDIIRWLSGRTGGGEGEDMTESSLSRALMRLVPLRDRSRAASLLRRLLAAPQGPVFVSEYDGKAARVYTTEGAAREACARHLNDEPGPDIPWDWFEDEFGWVMRRVDLDSGAPESLLGGKVTRTEVEG